MASIGTDSWGESAVATCQHIATELNDHGDRLLNVVQGRIEVHLNIIRNALREEYEKQTVTNHKP